MPILDGVFNHSPECKAPDYQECTCEKCCVCGGQVDHEECYRAEYTEIGLDLAICGDKCLEEFQHDEATALAKGSR